MPEPLRLLLHFDGEASWETLRSAASRVLAAMGAPSARWVCAERVELADSNFAGRAFRAQWTRPVRPRQKATIVEEATSGSGNPRDGYGYLNSWRLEMGTLVLELHNGSWDPRPRDLLFEVRTDTPATLEKIRKALREVLGKRRDRTAGPYVAVQNVRAVRDVDRGRAHAWLQEALARGRPEGDMENWHQLLLEREALEGPSEEGLARLLRDVPSDVDAWRRARTSPPCGWTPERVERVLERIERWKRGALVPPWNGRFDEGGTLWFQLDDGLGATRTGRERLDVLLLRAMVPALLQAPALSFDAVRSGDRTASSKVQAIWPGRSRRGVPFARVTREARRYERGWSRRSPMERLQAAPLGRLEHHWLWMRKAPVCVQLMSETLRIQGHEVHLGYALGVTPSFLDEVMEVMRTFCPFRWQPVDPMALFTEREPRQLYVGDDEKPTAHKLRTVLRRAGAATPEVLELLKQCGCRQEGGYCEHDVALINLERRFKREASEAETPRDRFRARARAHALSAALQHRRTGRVDRYELLKAVRDLAHTDACA